MGRYDITKLETRSMLVLLFDVGNGPFSRIAFDAFTHSPKTLHSPQHFTWLHSGCLIFVELLGRSYWVRRGESRYVFVVHRFLQNRDAEQKAARQKQNDNESSVRSFEIVYVSTVNGALLPHGRCVRWRTPITFPEKKKNLCTNLWNPLRTNTREVGKSFDIELANHVFH